MSPLVRAEHDAVKHYTKISRKLAQDETISLECRGMMAWLLAHKDDYNPSPRLVAKDHNVSIQRVYRIFKQLEKQGYMRKVWIKTKNKKGQFISATVYHVFEDKDMGRLYENSVPF